MNKVKITVLKTTLDRELAAEYGVPGLKACPMLREGQIFLADYAKPDGLCDEAWKAIYQYVFALAHRAPEDDSLFYYGDWIRKPGVAICSMQRRPAACDFQAGGHRRGSSPRLYARPLTDGKALKGKGGRTPVCALLFYGRGTRRRARDAGFRSQTY